MRFTAKKIWDGITAALLIVVLILALLLMGGRLLGLQSYIVLSGSMEPSYPVGSLVYVGSVEPETLEVGDVITFRLTGDSVATHRIVEVIGSGDEVQFRTKGDANDTEDGRLISATDVKGRVVFSIPGLGYLASLLQTGRGKALLIACGAFLMLLLILSELIFGEKEKTDQMSPRGGKKGV